MGELKLNNDYSRVGGGYRSVDEVYKAVVLNQPLNVEPEKRSWHERLSDDVVAPSLGEVVDNKRSIFRMTYPSISRVFGKIFRAFDIVGGVKEVYQGLQKDISTGGFGEETVVAVGRNVAKAAASAAILGSGVALSTGVFPLLVPGIFTVGLVGAGLYYLPELAAKGTEHLIRGFGYLAGNRSELGRQSYDTLRNTVSQAQDKFYQAESAINGFHELIEQRKY
jgi:hypothetical protein